MLSNALERRGLLVCFDRTDFDPGSSLSRALKRRVERSHRLLLVDTPEARRSKYVAEEIGHAIRRKRALVRIADSTSQDVSWQYVDPEGMGLDDIISLNEPTLAIALAAATLIALFAGIAYFAWRLRAMTASIVTTLQRARSAVVWDAGTGARLRTFPGGTNGVADAGSSPDGAMVVTTNGDGVTRLWDVRTGREHDILPRHSGQVAATFSPDGRFLYVLHGPEATSVYPIRLAELLELAKARLRQ